MNSHDAEGLPPSTPKPLASWYAQGLSDGLGDRLLMFDNSDAPSLELLRFRPDFAQAPGFETALREQVRRLGEFRHPGFATVRSVQRLEPDDDLALISNFTPGKRLSEVLHRARGPALAATLIRQLAPALALLQQHGAGVSHGVLSPERIVVSPEGRLTIVEHVVGPAIDALNLQAAQLVSMGIALAPAAGATAPRLDAATDWYQLGLVAVSVLIGRPVTANELRQLETLLDGSGHPAGSDGPGLSPFIREWLDRALQISGAGIESGADGRAALEELLHKERSGHPGRVGSSRHQQSVLSAPSPTDGSDRPADLTRDLAAESPAIVTPTHPVNGEGDVEPGPIELAPPEPAQVRQPTGDRPVLEKRVPWDANQDPAEMLELFDLEPVPAKTPAVDSGRKAPLHAAQAATGTHQPEPQATTRTRQPEPQATTAPPVFASPAAARPALYDTYALPRPPLYDPYAATRPPLYDPYATTQPGLHGPDATAKPHSQTAARWTISTSVVAALALIAVMEAGVIASLARALWRAPHPAIVVETTPSGENVLVSSRSTEVAPLRLTVAPDLRWVRVTAPSSAGILGGRVKQAPGGIIQITSPIELKVFEQSRLLGSVPGAGLKVPAGRHDIELVNVALGYRSQQAVEIEAGEIVSIYVAPPPGWVTVDASPWADVSLDGRAIGRTPLGPLPLAPGEHQLTFRHPAGGNDRQRVTVKSEAKTRVVGVLRP
jgi:hypothetical protein